MEPQEPNYDFMNTQPQVQAGPGSQFLQDPKNKLIAIVGLVVGVLTLVILVLGLIFSSGGSSNDNLLDLYGHQTEINRISELGLNDASEKETRVKVSTLLAFMSSDLSATTAYLITNGDGVLSEERLALEYTDNEVQEELAAAAIRGRYNEELVTILDEKIAEYKASLQAALSASSTPQQKQLIETAASNIILYENAQPAAESEEE